MIRIRYFAWLRAKVGHAGEEVELPDGVGTVGELMAWLARRHPGFAEVMAADGVVRAAVNHEHAAREEPVRDGDEVALFPPVTGG